MSKKYRNDGPNRIFHLSARVNWRKWYLADDESKSTFAGLVRRESATYGVGILGGVFMSNHVHLVTQSPPPQEYRRLTGRRLACRHFRPWPAGHPNSSVIAQFMKSVRSKMTTYWKRRYEQCGHFWESAYDARPVESLISLIVRIAYDHNNPVKQGMCRRAEEYPWSSAGCWATGRPGRFPVSGIDRPLFATSPADLRADLLAFQRSRNPVEFEEAVSQLVWAAEDDEAAWLALLVEHGLDRVLRSAVRTPQL